MKQQLKDEGLPRVTCDFCGARIYGGLNHLYQPIRWVVVYGPRLESHYHPSCADEAEIPMELRRWNDELLEA